MMEKLAFLATMLVFFLSSDHIEASLEVGFYREKCPFAERIIREEVAKAFDDNRGIAPGLVRLHFHDCFVRGCDGSILIDSTSTNQAEKDGPPNGITLRGLEVIDNAKARIEDACKGVVSCADILAYAARDSVVLTGGLYWDVPAGRRDGRISKASETVDIPSPSFNLDQKTRFFANKGLSQVDMVALVGAHSIGRSHCSSFASRLYNFSPTTSQDPSLNSILAEFLKRQCPRNEPENVVFMNQSPYLMDPSYYENLFLHTGLFTSDQALLESPDTTRQAEFYASRGMAWKWDFAQAMTKMSQIQVLTGNQGEIRAKCSAINP